MLADVLVRNAHLAPQREALVIDGKRLTYGALADQVAEMAHGLRALGLRRGDHVAVCMGNALSGWFSSMRRRPSAR